MFKKKKETGKSILCYFHNIFRNIVDDFACFIKIFFR